MQYIPSNAEAVVAGRMGLTHRPYKIGDEPIPGHTGIITVHNFGPKHDYARFQVGRVEAIQPGRGKKGIGYQRTISIHSPHPIQEITEEELIQEGIEALERWPGGSVWFSNGIDGDIGMIYKTRRDAFAALWDACYKRKGRRWADNPMVWGIGLEYVGQEKPI
jgi:hypothetical protein